MPAVTVIIPTHDRAHLLPCAIDSAREAGADIEILVVDDASTDETSAVCRNLCGVKYIRLERNQGVAAARNIGILESAGRYVTFLDDDDRRLPGSLDVQADALEANPEAGFVCGSMIMADQNYKSTGEVVRPRHSGGDVFWEVLELSFPIMGLSTLIRKDCFMRTGLLRQLSGIDDWDIFVRISELYSALVIDEAVGLYRYPTPSSAQIMSAQAVQLRRIARHQLKLLKLPRALAAPASRRRLARRRAANRIADTLLLNAARSVPSGEFSVVCANILAALRLNPLRAVRPGAYRKLAERLFVKSQALGK